MGALIFALDIGTRKVMGLVARASGDRMRVLAVEREEHRQRAMIDGQIHHIDEVAGVVARIRSRLEKRVRRPLSAVAVAAAGRSLTTVTAKAEEAFSPANEMVREDVMRLELQAVQRAQLSLLEQNNPDDVHHYRCVGYSVLEYGLDGKPIASLEGQRGDLASVKVIATFLPQAVIDSLFTVLKRAGLEMSSLTLEPIAAINVAVPPEMRLLNLALVDVGAGTSDLAITRGGSVIAYDMVPVAGDEVTEQLCQALLLDFPTAERIKRSLGEASELSFQDALGRSRTVTAGEVLAAMEPGVDLLAGHIADRILRTNGAAPQGIILVGGGSLTAGLPERLAACLQMDPARVAVRGREMLRGITGAEGKLRGPEAITPIGIAVSALHYQSAAFSNVEVNGRMVRLFNLGELRVRDALLAAGIDIRRLHRRPGRGLTVLVNGELHLVKGTLGEAAPMTLNGKPCSLDAPLRHGDRLWVGQAVHGEPASARLKDILPPLPPRTVTVNGSPLEIHPRITMNGNPVTLEDEVIDNAAIDYHYPETLQEVLALWEQRQGSRVLASTALTSTSDNRPVTPTLFLNERPAGPSSPVADGDVIEVGPPPVQVPGVPPPGVPATDSLPLPLRVEVNGQEILLAPVAGGPILANVLLYYPFDPSPARQGHRLVITRNGQPAEFSTPIQQGDRLELTWNPPLPTPGSRPQPADPVGPLEI